MGAFAATSPAQTWRCETTSPAQGGGNVTTRLQLTLDAGRVVGLAVDVTEDYTAVSGNPMSLWAANLDTSELAAAEKPVWTRQGATTQLRLEEGDGEATSVVRIVRQGTRAFVVHFDTVSSYHRGNAHFPGIVVIRAGDARCTVSGLQ